MVNMRGTKDCIQKDDQGLACSFFPPLLKCNDGPVKYEARHLISCWVPPSLVYTSPPPPPITAPTLRKLNLFCCRDQWVLCGLLS